MLNPSQRAGQAAGLPLTHSDCMRAVTALHHQRPGLDARLRVQVRRYHPDGHAVLCGFVSDLHENDGEWFAIETAIGRLWAPGKHVRLCSGDGRCTCEHEDTRPAC